MPAASASEVSPATEQWYRKSLEIEEQLGNRPGMALSCAQMGRLAEEQGNDQAALEWTIRCVSLFHEFPHPMTGSGPRGLVRFTRKLGPKALDVAWRRVTGQPCPDHVRSAVLKAAQSDEE